MKNTEYEYKNIKPPGGFSRLAPEAFISGRFRREKKFSITFTGMAGNTFGTLFRLTTFGESHGPAIGGVLDGCPAGLAIDPEMLRTEMRRRRPGQSPLTTQRNEEDEVEFLSGVFNGKTTGAPLAFLIRNKDSKPEDYDALKDVYRPSHADFTWEEKFGIRDHRGGGRSSARETASRVVGGALAKQLLKEYGITIRAFVKQVGDIVVDRNFDALELDKTDLSAVRCPDPAVALKMEKAIARAKEEGDSLGGIIQCVAHNVPAGLGEPVFDRLDALLSHAMMSINATKGFEIGSGFSSAEKKGSELNDAFRAEGDKIVTTTNNSGGVQGGISNGMPVWFNVAFKPPSTIMKTQQTVDRSGAPATIAPGGRHDPCVLPRAVPIVEAMAALVIADMLLLSRANRVK
jgi:chorismate synthase